MYTYDNEGNRLTRTSSADGTYTEYGWDNRNRLTSVTTYTSSAKTTRISQVTYTYDAFDRRVSKSVDADGSGTIDRHEFYAYDGGNVILDYAEVDGAEGATQQELKRYLDGPAVDQILAEEDLTQPTSAAARVLWHLLDNQGTARDLVDNSGALVEHYVYDAYGQLLSVTDQNGDLVEAPRSRYLYTGRELDLDTGLESYRGRWYDPAVGRFLSEDPIRFAAGDANLYRYVGNGPTNATDSSGLCESLMDEYVLSAQVRLIGVQALIDELRPSVERSANLRPPIPGGHAGLASWNRILGERQRLANLMWQAKGFSREMNHARARISPRPPVSKSPWKIS